MTDCMQKWRVGQIWDGCRSEIYSSDSSSRLCPRPTAPATIPVSKVLAETNRRALGRAVMLWCRWTRRSSFLETEGTSEGSTWWSSYRCTIGCWEGSMVHERKYASCQYAPSLMTLKRGYCARPSSLCVKWVWLFSLSKDELRTLTLGSQSPKFLHKVHYRITENLWLKLYKGWEEQCCGLGVIYGIFTHGIFSW